MPRAQAEARYGETMFDGFGVPSNVTSYELLRCFNSRSWLINCRLRLVYLEDFNLNCNCFDVVKSTGLLGNINFVEFKFNEEKATVSQLCEETSIKFWCVLCVRSM